MTRKGAVKIFFLVGFFLFYMVFESVALELRFPQTEEEIVEALSLKDGEIVHEGVTYVSTNQRVYKLINGKRVRMRGLALIAKTALAPKAGALILFDHDSSRIQEDSLSLLNEFGKALSGALVNAAFIVGGHTDAVGDAAYNRKLSEQRAESVADYLATRFNIGKERLRVEAYGEEAPLAQNESEAGRAKNRRVEFIRVE